MKVLVCGGRHFGDLDNYYPAHPRWTDKQRERNFIIKMLDRELLPLSDIFLIAGCATGVDAAALAWAKYNNIPHEEVKAEWKKYGNSAGPIRNKVMLNMGPEFIIGFPGEKGTANMLKISAHLPQKIFVYK